MLGPIYFAYKYFLRPCPVASRGTRGEAPRSPRKSPRDAVRINGQAPTAAGGLSRTSGRGTPVQGLVQRRLPRYCPGRCPWGRDQPGRTSAAFHREERSIRFLPTRHSMILFCHPPSVFGRQRARLAARCPPLALKLCQTSLNE